MHMGKSAQTLFLVLAIVFGLGAQAAPKTSELQPIDELRIEAVTLLEKLGVYDFKTAYTYVGNLSDQDVMQLLHDITPRPDPKSKKINVIYKAPHLPMDGLDTGGGGR